MRYASVCDGIGAAHVAWQPLGWECAWTSEIEPFPSAVVEHHYGFRNLGDMTKITEEMLNECGPVDLLVGGTPCQSFSVAGLRGGLADPRGNLALRFVQLAAVMQPRWIVWENVPGVLSSNKGRDFGTFLGALAELGYGFAYRVLDAQWFGVAQRRRRVFVVGHLGDWRRAAAVLFERESVFGHPPTRGKAWEGVARSTAASLTSSGRGVERSGESRGQDDVVLGRPIWRGGDQANSEHCIDHAGTLNCDKGQQGGIVGIPDPAYAISAGQQGKGGVFGSGRDSQDTFAVVAFHPTQDPISSTDGSTHAMGCGSSGGCCTQAVAFTAKDCGGDASKDVAPTMRAMGHSSSHANGGGQLAVAFTKSKRAQSTTDDETWVPGEVSPTMSCFDQGDTRATTVVATPIDIRQSARGDKDTNNRSGGGPPGTGLGGEGDPAFTVSERGQAVAQGFTYSGYSNQPAWMTGDRTDCLPASGHSDGSHQGVGVMQPSGVDFQNCASTGDVSGTIMGEAQKKGGEAGHGVLATMAVRRLTPRECERLQGFPDHYTLITYRNKPAADGPRYRALGNSMAVPVMRWIGERIALVNQLCGRVR